MNVKFRDVLEEKLRDPEFREGYEKLDPEFNIINAILDSRRLMGMTQKSLSKRTGISQGDISKLEKGIGNPSIKTLKRLAEGMEMTLKIEFVPNETLRRIAEAIDEPCAAPESTVEEEDDDVCDEFNSSMDALEEAQNSFSGEAERAGLTCEEDVIEMMKEFRRQRNEEENKQYEPSCTITD